MKWWKLVLSAMVVGMLVALGPQVLGPGIELHSLGKGAWAGQGGWLALLLAWVGGLATACTPCVYPLIPITLAVFGARQETGRSRAIALALTYDLGIALTYTSLGIVAALTGKVFAGILSNPAVMVSLALLMTMLAASMFGAFNFQFPAWMQTSLSVISRAGYSGAFLMGLLAGIVAAPCTGPILSGILVHVATTHDVSFGAALLFTYAVGIGCPFLLVAALSLRLPRSGAWMEGVKSALGIFLLALAVSYLRDASVTWREFFNLQSVAFGALICAALVMAGVLLGAVHRPFGSWSTGGILKGTGIVLAVAGLSMRPGAPLSWPAPMPAISWMSSEKDALLHAREAHKPVLIDFFADWCSACKQLDRVVYRDALFVREASRFVLVKIDGTLENEELEALYRKYQVDGLPTVIFVDSDGVVRPEHTIKGYMGPTDFVSVMSRVH